MIGPVYDDIRKAAQAETARAKAAFGDVYASPHEAWGVLMEEWGEAADELKAAECCTHLLSRAMRDPDERLLKLFDDIQYRALLTACELVQVAAVCEKAMGTLKQREVTGHGDPQQRA